MTLEAPAAPEPRRARPRRAALLTAVVVAAVCGFTYELVIVAFGAYLVGNSVLQTSLVLGAYVSAMGAGSLAARPLLSRPIGWFLAVEAAVALIGGLSTFALYGAFAWLDLHVPVTLALSVLIGALVGCEIPLLMALMQRLRAQDAGTSVAELLAADYAGAVVAGIGFPLLVLPVFGQLHGAIVVGLLNLAAAAIVLALFARSLTRRGRLLGAGTLAAVAAVLGLAAAFASDFEVTARQVLYDDPIRVEERSRYQDIVVTRSRDGRDTRLFLNGDLQFSSVDEYRYHEALVHPALAGRRERVLVLGGGDGLALREVLRYDDVREVTLVELDEAMTDLAADDERLSALNEGALRDPRVRMVHEDAFTWTRHRETSDRFDAIVVDFPDPDDAALAKLYSQEFYGMVRSRLLAPGGRMVVQAGSPFFAPRSYWSIERTVAAAGWRTTPFHVDVPSFGDWGFVLAMPDGGDDDPLRLDLPERLRFLDEGVLRAAATFPRDRDRSSVEVDVSTLDRPVVLDYARREWLDE